MIEIGENIFQTLVLIAAFVITFRNAYHSHIREWSVAALFYAVYAMADIYWMLILYFYHRNSVFYIADIGWYTGFLFLDLLLIMVSTEEERSTRYRALVLVPVFTLAMFAFFVYIKGDLVGNVITLFVMSFLLYRSVRGLMYLKQNGGGSRSTLYKILLAICIVEYLLWVTSCFWMGDTFANPYFWLDLLMTGLMLSIIPAIRKAVGS